MNPALLLQLLTSIPQIALGTGQYLSAIKQAKSNIRPTYGIDPSYQYNIDLIKQNMGLPKSVVDTLYNQVGQATTAGINAVNQAGGNPNQIAKILQNQNQQFQDVLVKDALAQKSDINSLMLANTALAEQNDKAFQINQLDPFKDRAEAIAREKAAGLNNIQMGGNSVSGAFASNATANLYKDLFGNDKISSTAPPATGTSDYYANLVKQLMPQTGFQQYGNPAPNMNLGQNNFNTMGLPNYSFNAPLYGGSNYSQYGNGFDPFAFNPYMIH